MNIFDTDQDHPVVRAGAMAGMGRSPENSEIVYSV